MQPHLQEAVRGFVAAAGAAFGPGAGVALYGSAARGEHVEGFSDLNLLVIVDDLGPARLVRFGEALAPLGGRGLAPPLLLTRLEWARSADTFPIEIADLQVAREVLEGPDPVAGLTVDRATLRQAIERDLRGKLLRLRQGYAVLHGEPAALADLGVRSISTVAVLLRVALVLASEPAPVATPAVLAGAGRRIGFDPDPLVRYFAARGAGSPPGDADLFARYLAAVETAVRFIDQFDVGDKG